MQFKAFPGAASHLRRVHLSGDRQGQERVASLSDANEIALPDVRRRIVKQGILRPPIHAIEDDIALTGVLVGSAGRQFRQNVMKTDLSKRMQQLLTARLQPRNGSAVLASFKPTRDHNSPGLR
ncbi:MAG: hypothetical protein AAFY19_13395, partial [Pseudomonadota bacterium]